ncbi:hypothetical protein LINPERPRIM_LOCUS21099 [Linum perenne]
MAKPETSQKRRKKKSSRCGYMGRGSQT